MLDKDDLKGMVPTRDRDLLETVVYASYIINKRQIKHWVQAQKIIIESIYKKAARHYSGIPDMVKILSDIGRLSEELQNKYSLDGAEALRMILNIPYNSNYNLSDPVQDDTVDFVYNINTQPELFYGYLLDDDGAPIYCMKQTNGKIFFEQMKDNEKRHYWIQADIFEIRKNEEEEDDGWQEYEPDFMEQMQNGNI